MTIVYRVLQPIPAVGAISGDYLVLRPGHTHRFVLHRDLDPDLVRVLTDLRAVDLVNHPPPVWAYGEDPRLRDHPPQA